MTVAKPAASAAAPRVEPRVVPAQRLEQAPRAVEQVDAEGDVGDDVEDRDREPGQAGVDVVVHVAAHEVGVEPAPRQVGEVEDEEQQRR